MAVPRRPHQPRAPRTTRASRISTHAATRAPQHTSPAHLRLFAPCAGSADCFWHLISGCTRTRREYDADSAPRKARTHARTRTRAHPLSLLHSLSACLHTQHTAPSARVLHTAPLPPRACLHCTRRARGTLRARTPARARARALPLSAAQTASLHTQHTAPCARIRLTMQPALHNNSLPHASPRHPALTPPAARSEKLQRAPLHACSLSAL